MTILGGVILYVSLALLAAGFISVLFPLRFLRIRTRRRALLVLGCGMAGFAAGVCLPVGETRIQSARTRLDEFAPVYQFSEFHSIEVAASKDRVDAAIRAVRPGEIRYFNTLMKIRGLSVPDQDRPILEAFTKGWFMLLADEPGREIVFGHLGHRGRMLANTPDEFKAIKPGPSLSVAMNFRIDQAGAQRCRLTTETRVYAEGAQVRRGFATYWRMIYPGSSLIRSMWLRAIKNRADKPNQA